MLENPLPPSFFIIHIIITAGVKRIIYTSADYYSSILIYWLFSGLVIWHVDNVDLAPVSFVLVCFWDFRTPAFSSLDQLYASKDSPFLIRYKLFGDNFKAPKTNFESILICQGFWKKLLINSQPNRHVTECSKPINRFQKVLQKKRLLVLISFSLLMMMIMIVVFFYFN